MEKKKNIFIVFILVVLIGIAYNLYRLRTPAVPGFRCGSQEIPSSSLRNYYILHFDSIAGKNGESVKIPLYAILWKAKPTGPKYSSNWQLVKMITAGEIAIPSRGKAIYALQPDFTMSILPLREVERNAIFDMFLSSKKKNPFNENSIWRSQVAPNLVIVEISGK